MRKRCLVIVGFVLVAFSALAQKNGHETLRVLHSSAMAYAFELQIHDFRTEISGDYLTIDAGAGFSSLREVGKPALPVLHQIIAVPLGAEPKLDFSVGDIAFRTLSKPLQPAQPHQFKNRATDFVVDTAFYTSHSVCQPPVARLTALGTMRGLRLFRVTVSPFGYIPNENKLLYHSKVEVRITFAGADEQATAHEIQRNGGLPSVPIANKAVFENLLSRNTIATPKYVVVAHDSFAAALRPFLWWKRQSGFNVVELYTHSGDTCTYIRSRLDSLYSAATPLDPAPSFLLIVGDVEHVPAFGGKVRITDLPQHSTDLYYAEYTGDFYPDVPYGRISVADTAELRHVLDKTIAYEHFVLADTSYLNRFTLVAGRENRNPAPTVTNGQINYLKNNYLLQNPSFDTHIYYNPASENQLSQIVNDLDLGASLVNYTSHCLSIGWYRPNYTSEGVDTLGNVGRYFFSVNNCCLSSRFADRRCFGEALLRKARAGAVGVIGAANETLWEEDYYWAVGAKGTVSLNAQYDSLRLGSFDRLWHTHGEQPTDYAPTAGELLQAGNFGLTQMGMDFENYYWEIYNLLGDPSLMPYFGVPQPIVLNIPDSLPVGASHLSLSGTPFARVAFVQDSQLIASVLFDGNGVADVDFSRPLSAAQLLATATAQFRQTLSDTIAAYISTNPLLAFDSVSVENTLGVPVENHVVKAGNQYAFHFCIKNFGSDTAPNIHLALSSLDGRCSVSNAVFNRSSLLPADTAWVSTIFTFVPNRNLSEGTIVSINALMTSGLRDTVQRRFDFVVRSTEVETGTISVWRNAMPVVSLAQGESYTLKVPVTNRGSELSDTVSVCAGVVSGNGSVILPDTVLLSPLAAHATDTAEFAFSLGTSATAYIDFAIGLRCGVNYKDTFLRLPLGQAVETFESGDFSLFAWDTTHANRWQIDTVPSHAFAGQYSARSAAIGHKQRSVLAVTMTTIADDSIVFWRRTSTEASADYLMFYIDDVRQERWAGSGHYERMAYFVPSGTHTFSWIYVKDASETGGSDCVWIDDITFPLSQMDTTYHPPLPLGIADAEVQNRCKVYPNPAKKLFIVENTENELVDMVVHNAYGQIVDKKSLLPGQQLYYNTEKLRCGVYILFFATKSKCYTQKLIISR